MKAETLQDSRWQGLCVFKRRALLQSMLFHSLGWMAGGVAASALGMKFRAHSAARGTVLTQTQTHLHTRTQAHIHQRKRGRKRVGRD